MRIKFLFAVLFASLFFIGCTKTAQDIANNVEYKFNGVDIEFIKSAKNVIGGILFGDMKKALKLNLIIKVDVNNKNSISLNIKSVTYKVYINGQYVGTGNIDTPISINGNSKSTIKMPFLLNSDNLAKSGINIFKDRTILISIKGESIIDTKIITLKVPFEIKENKIKINSADML